MKMSEQIKNVIFFTNGSIGDFLMVLFFFSILQKKGFKNTNFFAVTPRNGRIFSELSFKYKCGVLECSLKNTRNLFKLLSLSFSRNIVITPPSSGIVPLKTKILAKILSIFSKSQLWGFDDHFLLNRYFYDYFYNFPEKRLYSESLIELAEKISDNEELSGTVCLEFEKEDSIFEKYGIKVGNYFVVHPCGSGKSRTFTSEYIREIVLLLRKTGKQVIFTGSKKDFQYIEDAISAIKDQNILNLAGKLSMKGLVSVLNGAKLYIGVDTGITHLASMISVRSVVVSHSASVYYWLPYYNSKAKIIYNIKNCPHHIYEGLEHCKSCYNETENYFMSVPLKAVLETVSREIETISQ